MSCIQTLSTVRKVPVSCSFAEFRAQPCLQTYLQLMIRDFRNKTTYQRLEHAVVCSGDSLRSARDSWVVTLRPSLSRLSVSATRPMLAARLSRRYSRRSANFPHFLSMSVANACLTCRVLLRAHNCLLDCALADAFEKMARCSRDVWKSPRNGNASVSSTSEPSVL